MLTAVTRSTLSTAYACWRSLGQQHPAVHQATPAARHHASLQVLGLLASGLLAASATAFALEECARRGQAYLLTFTGEQVAGWSLRDNRVGVGLHAVSHRAMPCMPCHVMPCRAVRCRASLV